MAGDLVFAGMAVAQFRRIRHWSVERSRWRMAVCSQAVDHVFQNTISHGRHGKELTSSPDEWVCTSPDSRRCSCPWQEKRRPTQFRRTSPRPNSSSSRRGGLVGQGSQCVMACLIRRRPPTLKALPGVRKPVYEGTEEFREIRRNNPTRTSPSPVIDNVETSCVIQG